MRLDLIDLYQSEIIERFKSIPETETSLDLSNNNLNQQDPDVIATGLATMNAKIANLDLSYNGIGFLRTRSVPIFKNISELIQTLNLSGNKFGEHTSNILISSLTSLHDKKIIEFDLSGNELNLQGKGIINILKEIPKSVKILKLSNNSLFKIDPKVLADAFAQLPQIKVLDITYNNFDNITDKELDDLLVQCKVEKVLISRSRERIINESPQPQAVSLFFQPVESKDDKTKDVTPVTMQSTSMDFLNQ